MSEFDKALDALAEDVIQPWSPTVKDEIRAMIVKFLDKYTARSMIEKVKHTLTDEPHYHLLLAWPEIQALVDVTDALPESDNTEYGVDFNKLCAKMSAQLKWQALTVLKEYGSMGLEDPETADPTEPEPGFDEHCHCNRGIRTAPNDKKYCPKHGYEYTEDGQ